MRYLYFVLLALVTLLLAGCKTTEYVPIEVLKTDSIYITKVRVDSIVNRDSIVINTYTKGDTVFVDREKFVYRYKDKLRTDTMIVEKVDSICYTKTVEVEKKLSWWESLKQEIGGFAIGIAIALMILILGNFFIKKFS